MKQPKEIARQSAIPKRGRVYIIAETGQTVYLDRVKSPTVYFVCDVPPPDKKLEGNYFDVRVDQLKEQQSFGSSISAKPKVLTKVEKSSKDSLNDFFKAMYFVMPYNCEECGKPLYAHNEFAKRCVTCHILPKSIFPEIATNPDNIFFMGAELIGVCADHNAWDDKDSAHRKTMYVYPLALERFEKLKVHLSPKKYVQACTYLGIDWQ